MPSKTAEPNIRNHCLNMLYRSSYDSQLLRGVDDPLMPRPWNVSSLLSELAQENHRLLDLGSGTGFKLLPVLKKFNHIVSLDISKSMLLAAKNSLNSENTSFIQGNNFNLPFRKNSFDTVTSFLSLWDASEIHRVLKTNGSILLELIGCEDKREFKLHFGADEKGLRGQLLQYEPTEYLNKFYETFSKYFCEVTLKNGFWNTYYSKKGILKLLCNTPTIRDFNYKKDKPFIKAALNELATPNGIKIQQNRVLLYAKSPK